MTLSPQRVAPMTNSDFQRISDVARGYCGLNLQQGKRELVSSRLERLVRLHACDSFTSYLALVSRTRTGPVFTEFIDTLTTNHTGFWREPAHFIYLLETILRRHKSRIRVWSAGCATGEEPYTIGMCAREAGLINCRIVASDISRSALHAAASGRYDAAKLGDLPAGWTERYLSSPGLPGLGGGNTRVVSVSVRGMVDFAPVNLLEPFSRLGMFDVIFCRNVMIYFEQSTRDQLVGRLAEQLTPGGYLFTAHSESLLRLPAGLVYVQPAIYRKAP